MTQSSTTNMPPNVLGFTPLNVGGSIKVNCRARPHRHAISDGVRLLTYGELGDRIERVRVGTETDFRGMSGRRAMILAPDCLEYIEIVLGVSQVGMATATPNFRLSAKEIREIVDDCTPDVIFVHHSCVANLEGVTAPKVVIGIDYEEWLGVTRTSTALADVDECAPFSIPYTSGTTGRPKGVLLSHRSRVLTAQAMAVEYGCFGPDDNHLATAPLCHGAGFAFALAALSFGGRLELLGRFDPERMVQKLSKEPFTSTFMVPSHFHSIFELDPEVLERNRSTPTLKAIISNAAPLPTATKEKILAFWGDGKLFECYGSTENGIVGNLRPDDQRRKRQCVGLPFPNTEIRIVDARANSVGVNEVGKIFTRSPYLFNGYFNRTEQTDAAFADGWATVGDLGRRDEEGFLYIVGREQDMVITGGINVYPKEIEDVIAAHSAVMEVAVIGVPDDRWGEALRAFVVLNRDMSASVEEIDAHCRGRIAAFKVPKVVTFLQALPKSATGKILKRELADYDE